MDNIYEADNKRLISENVLYGFDGLQQVHSTVSPETIQFYLIISFPRPHCGILSCHAIFHAALSLKPPHFAVYWKI